MRLKETEIKNILKGLLEYSQMPESFELYLFGSRTIPNKKGGDIDLLLLVEQKDLDFVLLKKHYIITYLKKYIDEQRLDLTVLSKEKVSENSFYNSIQKDLILLLVK